MSNNITNILSIHFDTEHYTEFDVMQYMLDMGLSTIVIAEHNGWYIVKLNKMLKLDNDTRIAHNHDYTIIYEYEIII